jgi:hypothetical protein
MTKQFGTGRYNNKAVLAAVRLIKPRGSIGWNRVANEYKERSKEVKVCDPSALKRHFMEKLCGKGKKPTGRSAPHPLLAEAQEVLKLIFIERKRWRIW